MLFDPNDLLGLSDVQKRALEHFEALLSEYEQGIINADQILDAVDNIVLSIAEEERYPLLCMYEKLCDLQIVDDYALLLRFL